MPPLARLTRVLSSHRRRQVILSFSNRMFHTKAFAAWREASELARVWVRRCARWRGATACAPSLTARRPCARVCCHLVRPPQIAAALLHYAGFEVDAQDISPLPKGASDPLYIVRGRKPGGEGPASVEPDL